MSRLPGATFGFLLGVRLLLSAPAEALFNEMLCFVNAVTVTRGVLSDFLSGIAPFLAWR